MDGITLTFMPCVAKKLNISGNELIIYALIYSYTKDGNGVFFAGKEYIAETFGMGVTTVYKVIARLAKRGLIKQCEKTANSANSHYRVNMNLFNAALEETERELEKKKEKESKSKGLMPIANQNNQPSAVYANRYDNNTYYSNGQNRNSSYYARNKKFRYDKYLNYPDDPEKEQRYAEEAYERALKRSYGE